MPSTQPNPRPHVPALDGIRGLAILLVLAYHLLASSHGTGSPLMNALSMIPTGLWVGVDLFFVLSGFLITGILYDSLQDEGYFRKFYGRRTVRIFPLYYGLLIGLFIFTIPLHLAWERMPPALLLYLQNTTIFEPIFHYDPSPKVHLNHLWSLAVEEQFYLVWPLIVFWLRDLRRILIAALAGSAVALALRIFLTWHGMGPALLYVSTPLRADSLLIGSALALGLRSAARERIIAGANLLMIVAAACTAAVIFHDRQFNFSFGFLVPSVGYTLLALFSAGLIASCFRPGSRLKPIFETHWLRFLGKYSYGIYIFHFPLDSWLTLSVREFLRSITHSRVISDLGGAIVLTMLSIIAAWLSYNLYERHFLRLKRYFEYN